MGELSALVLRNPRERRAGSRAFDGDSPPGEDREALGAAVSQPPARRPLGCDHPRPCSEKAPPDSAIRLCSHQHKSGSETVLHPQWAQVPGLRPIILSTMLPASTATRAVTGVRVSRLQRSMRSFFPRLASMP